MKKPANPHNSAARVDVSFGVSGDSLLPSVISSRLGLQADWAFAKGEEFQSRSGVHKRFQGVWAIESRSHVASDDLADHVKFILEVLGPAREAVREIKQDPSLRVSVGIWWEPEEGRGGYTLRADLVAALCEYCNEIDFYFA